MPATTMALNETPRSAAAIFAALRSDRGSVTVVVTSSLLPARRFAGIRVGYYFRIV